MKALVPLLQTSMICFLFICLCFNVILSSVTAKFDHQLVRSAPLVLSSPLQFQSLLSVTFHLQFIYGVTSAATSIGTSTGGDGVRRHGVGREAVRL